VNAPCVRVPREAGEETRERLVDAGLFDGDRQIAVEDGEIYVPVVDADAVPADLAVVDRATGGRDSQTTPADLLDEPPTYERLGDIVVIDEDDPEQARAVADAVVASDVPCETVLNRASKVTGEYRVREWERLAGESTETVHREYGHEFLLDPTAVYFSPRLATERHRVVEQVGSDERVLDMFAGVGPFAVPAASRGAEVVAVDANPAAIPYLRENARRNGVADRLTAVEADVRRVVSVDETDAVDSGDTTDSGDTDTADYRDWADRLVANLPHSADEFLDTAVAIAGDDCVLHYYDIQHEDDPFGPGARAIRAAVAASEDDYDVTVETEQVVRSYAPHELNVCLDVRLRR
jgi:tRNA (guanine37-N1)-methyltransferase